MDTNKADTFSAIDLCKLLFYMGYSDQGNSYGAICGAFVNKN